MNKVMLVGRLTRDPELRSLPSGKAVANFVIATNEYRGNGAGERTEYHNVVAWDRLAEICGQFLSKGQLVDVEGEAPDRAVCGHRRPSLSVPRCRRDGGIQAAHTCPSSIVRRHPSGLRVGCTQRWSSPGSSAAS